MLSGISVLVWYGNLIIFRWEYSTKALENKIVHTMTFPNPKCKKKTEWVLQRYRIRRLPINYKYFKASFVFFLFFLQPPSVECARLPFLEFISFQIYSIGEKFHSFLLNAESSVVAYRWSIKETCTKLHYMFVE